jgi:MFS family permease
MPVFARDIFHGGPKILGLLVSMAGLGALTGAIFLASRKSALGLGKIIAFSAVVFGMGLIFFSFSTNLEFSLGMLFISGFAMMVQMASSNTILQTIVEEDKRGRVMGFYTLAFMGMSPLGSLIAGSVASYYGAPVTILGGGTVCVAGGLIFARKLSDLGGL